MDQHEAFADYRDFDPRDYLQAYYQPLGPEADGLLRFLVELFANLPGRSDRGGGPSVLEFGAGPTIVGMICAARVASVLDVCDYVRENRGLIERWLAGDESDFDWTPYLERTLQYETGSRPSGPEIAARAQRVRNLVKRVLPCDITTVPPLDSGRTYDVIVSNYCLDAVTNDKSEWYRHILALRSLLNPGGTLMLSSLREARYSDFGETRYPNVFLQPDDLPQAFDACGFVKDSVRVSVAPADHEAREYTGVIFASAKFLP